MLEEAAVVQRTHLQRKRIRLQLRKQAELGVRLQDEGGEADQGGPGFAVEGGRDLRGHDGGEVGLGDESLLEPEGWVVGLEDDDIQFEAADISGGILDKFEDEQFPLDLPASDQIADGVAAGVSLELAEEVVDAEVVGVQPVRPDAVGDVAGGAVGRGGVEEGGPDLEIGAGSGEEGETHGGPLGVGGC